MDTNKTLKIYLWKDNKISQSTPKLIIKNMSSKESKTGYIANDNAVNLAKLLMMGCPGNTLDIILESIANEIKPMLESPDKIEILKSSYDIENRIRIALNQLADKQ